MAAKHKEMKETEPRLLRGASFPEAVGWAEDRLIIIGPIGGIA
jgi:hypothetical protein